MDTIGGFKIVDSPEETKIETPETPATPGVVEQVEEGGQPEEPQKPWWSEQFESEDKVREVVSQYSSLVSERDELKSKLETSRYADPVIETLNGYIAQNEGADVKDVLSKFSRVYGKDFESMEPLDVIKESLQINEGYTSRQVDDYVLAELSAPRKLSPDELEDLSHEERSDYDRKWAAYRVKVDREFRSARSSMADMKAKLTPKPAERKAPEQIAQENQARLAKVKETASSLSLSFKAGEYGDVEFVPTKEQVAEIERTFSQVQGMEGDMTGAMTQYAKAAFFPQIIQKVISDIKAKETANTHAELSNATPGGAAVTPQTEDPNAKLSENIAKAFAGV